MIRIMAIINTSPDSFSGDGIAANDKAAVRKRLRAALDEGADILDIGGQSTRPGAELIDVQEEIRRVVPVIQAARKLTDKPISVDTFKPEVARAALEAGATMVNDIHGAEDPETLKLIQQAGCEVVVMHSRGTPQTMSQLTDYPGGVVPEVCTYLKDRAKALEAAGIATEKIIIDPGIGFAKTAPQSFELTRHLNEVAKLGYPVLYGASQKSFIGKALAQDGHMAPVEERTTGSYVLQAYAMLHGAAIIRTHDVKAAIQIRTVIEALRAEREVIA
jgi:dihydropteroate synthase